MKKAIALLLVFTLFSLSAAESMSPAAPADQRAELDSLYANWLNEDLPDTTRLNAIYLYGKIGYLNRRPDSAFYFAQLQYDFAKDKGVDFYMAKAVNTQGISYAMRGNFPEAIRLINEGIDIYTALGEHKESSSTLMNLANVYLILGDYSNALATYDRALDIGEALGDKNEISRALSHKAIVYISQGKVKESLELYQRSLKLMEELNDKSGAAGVLSSIGSIYNGEGHYPLAIETYFKALKLKETLGDKSEIAAMLNSIASIYEIQGNHEQAIKHFQRSYEYNQEAGNPLGTIRSLLNLGGVMKTQGAYEKAMEYTENALQISREVGSQPSEASALSAMAQLYELQNKPTEAVEHFQASLALYEAMGAKKPVAQTLSDIGDFYARSMDFEKSLSFHLRSLSLLESMGAKTLITDSKNTIGSIYNQLKQYKQAVTYCKSGLDLAQETGVLLSQKNACSCLSEAHKNLNDPKQALFYFERMTQLNDSLFNEEFTQKLTRLEMGYEYDKKVAIAKLEQDKKDQLAAQELKQQILVRNGFILGFLIVLLFAGIFFKQRNQIKIGKKRSDELLLNILPAEVADELKEKGAVGSKRIDAVTVLFTDFKGFTAMAEQLSPKDLVEDLNICFSEFDRIMEKYGIEKIKTIGDAYMAAGGLPLPDDQHAQHVVQAAFEMRDFVEAGKMRKIAAQLPHFEIRIGIHTGPVVAGIVGIKKFQYDIWGDTVNTASRMESSGAVGKVNISDATYALVKDDPGLSFENRGKIAAKGKGDLEMWFVTNA